MAPEVITEGKLYDTKADVWSLGVTVYEIATGNPPLVKYEPLRAIQMIPKAIPPKLPETSSDGNPSLFTPNMREFMSLALTIDPAQRPSAEELGKSKWIKGASKMPTTLLRELIVRYGGWVNAGGKRMSIIDDVQRRCVHPAVAPSGWWKLNLSAPSQRRHFRFRR
jgi:serine/threonine protein kinase